MKRLLKGRLKSLCLAGKVFLRLTAVEHDCDGGGDERPVVKCAFAHISMLYERPFRPTLRTMRLADSPPGQGAANERRCVLRATDEFVTLFEFLRALPLEDDEDIAHWRMGSYRLSESRRPVLRLDPRSVEVERLDGEETLPWNRGPSRRAKIARSVADAWAYEFRCLVDPEGPEFDPNYPKHIHMIQIATIQNIST